MEEHKIKMAEQISHLIHKILNSPQSSGILLIICTLISITLSNTTFSGQYLSFWNTELSIGIGKVTFNMSLSEFINDALMTIFFLVVGMELKHEMVGGELSDRKKAMLPVIAAIGGVIVPSMIYLIFNWSDPNTIKGWAIPTATDIAFSIGIITMLKNKVNPALKIFLLALAIVDDLIAVIVIAIFYTFTIGYNHLFIVLSIFGFMLLMNRLNIKSLFLFLICGTAMWYFMLQSGVHATIAGVLTAIAIPQKSPSRKFKHIIDKFEYNMESISSFIIIPLFALSNTCIVFNLSQIETININMVLGIILGLVIGKPLGITLFSLISSKIGITKLPANFKLLQLIGVACLGGIGFTMSIFVSILAYEDSMMQTYAKISILTASLLSSIFGVLILSLKPRKHNYHIKHKQY